MSREERDDMRPMTRLREGQGRLRGVSESLYEIAEQVRPVTRVVERVPADPAHDPQLHRQ